HRGVEDVRVRPADDPDGQRCGDECGQLTLHGSWERGRLARWSADDSAEHGGRDARVPGMRKAAGLRLLIVRLDEHLRVGFIDPAVAALARLEVDDRLEEIAAAKIGPENFRDVNLRVCDLPQ